MPGNSGPRRSIAALFSLTGGIEAHQTQIGSLTGADFAGLLQKEVLPHLVAGDVLVLDNARCHKGARVRELVESAGARLLFLPAYSPDFSPIELAWRKVKSRLRQAGARTEETLLLAIGSAMQAVTAQDARAFYAHCGYTELAKT